MLASTADLLDDEGGIRIAGDPVDGAFLLALAAAGGADPRSGGRTRVRVVPFDPTRRRLTAVYEENGRRRVARERRAGDADRALLPGGEGAPPVACQGNGLGRRTDCACSPSANECSAAIRWPTRTSSTAASRFSGSSACGIPSVQRRADSIRRARAEGVGVAILTGDHPVTATAIARALELPDGVPLTGLQLEALDDAELGRAIQDHSVFARVTPADKLRLVEALQRAGHVVAVTGDGINDTPALRRADVGVAMGGSGTESAREAADVVLTDDDFATIVAAIHEGRRIADNIRNFVAFLLSANLGEVVLFAIAIIAGIGAPMTVVQVLTVNLLTDGLPAVALSRDPASVPTARSRPRGHDSLFPRPLQLALVLMGLAVGLAATAAYVIGRALEPDAAQTMAFATLATPSSCSSSRSARAPRRPGRLAAIRFCLRASCSRSRCSRCRSTSRRCVTRSAPSRWRSPRPRSSPAWPSRRRP